MLVMAVVEHLIKSRNFYRTFSLLQVNWFNLRNLLLVSDGVIFAMINSFVGLRLVYYDKETQPRVWIRSPGVSKKTCQNSAADFVPIYSGS